MIQLDLMILMGWMDAYWSNTEIKTLKWYTKGDKIVNIISLGVFYTLGLGVVDIKMMSYLSKRGQMAHLALYMASYWST